MLHLGQLKDCLDLLVFDVLLFWLWFFALLLKLILTFGLLEGELQRVELFLFLFLLRLWLEVGKVVEGNPLDNRLLIHD